MMVEKCTEHLPANDVIKVYDNMMQYEHNPDLFQYYKIDYGQFEFADVVLDLTDFQLKLIDKIKIKSYYCQQSLLFKYFLFV